MKFFLNRNKRTLRNLSDELITRVVPKKIRDGSLDWSYASQTKDIPDYIFTKSLNYTDCDTTLLNCLKNLQCKMREISTASQIKGEELLLDLTHPVHLISHRFEKMKSTGMLKMKY